jgi:hypothetical protein
MVDRTSSSPSAACRFVGQFRHGNGHIQTTQALTTFSLDVAITKIGQGELVR